MQIDYLFIASSSFLWQTRRGKGFCVLTQTRNKEVCVTDCHFLVVSPSAIGRRHGIKTCVISHLSKCATSTGVLIIVQGETNALYSVDDTAQRVTSHRTGVQFSVVQSWVKSRCVIKKCLTKTSRK